MFIAVLDGAKWVARLIWTGDRQLATGELAALSASFLAECSSPPLNSYALGTQPTIVLELSAVTERFKAYVAGASSRSQLEFWIADQVLAVTSTDSVAHAAASPESVLAYRLGEAFCVLQADDEEAAHFASRILGCLDQVTDVDGVHDILPLIRQHEAFSVLISKHARGLISRSGFRSIVKKRFPSDSVRPWLEAASLEQLVRLTELIEREDFVSLRSLLALPPA